MHSIRRPTELHCTYLTLQDSTERAARVLPDIIKLLVDSDITVVGEAASLMHQLAKKEPSKHAIIGTQNAITSLVRVMANTNDFDIQRNISGALYHLSKARYGQVNTSLSSTLYIYFDIIFVKAYKALCNYTYK